MSETIEKESIENMSELEILKNKADVLGVEYHPNIGAEKLKTRIEECLIAKMAKQEKEPVVSDQELKMRRYQEIRDNAMKLVRVIVNCMNPDKQEWTGQFFQVSNRAIGDVTKFVPFNNENGLHVPYCIYQLMVNQTCPLYHNTKDKRTGIITSSSRLIREFNVVLLPDLTEEEMKQLAAQQALNHSID